jgi:hypothetical protein
MHRVRKQEDREEDLASAIFGKGRSGGGIDLRKRDA